MKRGSKIKLSLLVMLLCISFILLFYEVVFNNKSIKTYEISVISSGKSDESMILLKEGTEQAASELNANIRFISLSQDQYSQEQIELLKRESKNSVDAIIISPIDCQEVMEAIEEVKKTVQVIIIQSALKTSTSIDRIANDDYLLGQQLVSTALENIGEDRKIAIVNSSVTSTVIEERYVGSTKVLEDKGRGYYRYVLNNYEKDSNYSDIEKIILKENIGAIVCLDTKSSEYIGEFKKSLAKDLSQNFRIYGVGSTNKIISLLEEDIINGTATQNEFNIGYLAVQNIISNKKRKKAMELKLKSNIVTSENMYLDENERILFQFVR